VAFSVCEEGERWLDNNSLVEESILPPVWNWQESRVAKREDPVSPKSAGMNLYDKEDG